MCYFGGQAESRQLMSCCTSAFWEGLLWGLSLWLCGVQLHVDSSSLCYAWPGSGLERDGALHSWMKETQAGWAVPPHTLT